MVIKYNSNNEVKTIEVLITKTIEVIQLLVGLNKNIISISIGE